MTVLEGLAPALADAIHAAVGPDPAPLAFVWIELRLIGGSERPVIPRALAVDVTYRDRARTRWAAETRSSAPHSPTTRRPGSTMPRPDCCARLRQALQSFYGELPTSSSSGWRGSWPASSTRATWATWTTRSCRWCGRARDPDLPTSTVLGERARPRAALVAARRAKPEAGADAGRPRAAAGAATESGLPAEGGPRRRGRRVGHPARPGFRREPDRRPAVLADAWPLDRDGRPLTHLATLCAGRVADVEGRKVFPIPGTWTSSPTSRTRRRSTTRSDPATS